MTRLVLLLLASLILSGSMFGQSADLTIECRQWDDAFITNFYVGVAIAAVVTFFAAFFSGLGERIFPGAWIRRQPWYRHVLVFIVAFVVTSFILVFVPRWYLGGPVYSGVDPMYRNCVTQPFGAAGLLVGRVGAGTAAYAQKPALLLTILVACALAAFLSWALGRRRAATAMRAKE